MLLSFCLIVTGIGLALIVAYFLWKKALSKHNGTTGVKVRFNPNNTYGAPCCCEKGYLTKFSASTMFCVICNTLALRKHCKVNSWCKKYKWDKTCSTCNQHGLYNEDPHGKINS